MAGKGRTGPNRLYSIWRKTTRPDGLLPVPSDIVAIVPPATVFTVELTDEGILYRVSDAPDKEPVKAPKWTKNSSGNHKKPEKASSKTAARKRTTSKRPTRKRTTTRRRKS